MGFSLTIQLWGYPHDCGNPHIPLTSVPKVMEIQRSLNNGNSHILPSWIVDRYPHQQISFSKSGHFREFLSFHRGWPSPLHICSSPAAEVPTGREESGSLWLKRRQSFCHGGKPSYHERYGKTIEQYGKIMDHRAFPIGFSMNHPAIGILMDTPRKPMGKWWFTSGCCVSKTSGLVSKKKRKVAEFASWMAMLIIPEMLFFFFFFRAIM